MTANQTQTLDFSEGDKAGLVSIGSHSLFLRASGPDRKMGESVVIIECGHSDSSITWAAAQRCISSFARVYSYDRAGYGHSEPSNTPRTAENIAHELLALLRVAKIRPPYVLVGHSYGGILIREFLALLVPEQMVTGMILVDANQEKTHLERPLPKAQLATMLGHLDSYQIMGLEDTHKLTSDEWRAAKASNATKSHSITAERESEHMVSSANILAGKRQLAKQILGSKRVSIIKGNTAKDMALIYRGGVHAGNGTTEDRDVFEAFLDGLDNLENKLQSEQLGLSYDGRMVHATESGHNVHLQQPEIIAQEVRWVLGQTS
jgi:pimeloyl-ACP methyl ester carboxylesterase